MDEVYNVKINIDIIKTGWWIFYFKSLFKLILVSSQSLMKITKLMVVVVVYS